MCIWVTQIGSGAAGRVCPQQVPVVRRTQNLPSFPKGKASLHSIQRDIYFRRFDNERVLGDYPGGPVVKTSHSNAGAAGSNPDRGNKIPHFKTQNIKQKQYCYKFNKGF